MDIVALAPLYLASYSAPSLTLSYCFVSLVRFRVQLSATLLTIKQSDPFAWSREGSRSWVFEFPVLARARPTTTDKQTVPWVFFFGFGRATPFYGASPEPPPSTRTDNHAVGFHLGTHSSRLKEELERKRRREKGKKKKLKIHDRHSTFGDCSKQEQQQRSSNHRIILLRVTRPSEQDASLNAVHSITIETNSSPANPFLPYDRSSASHQ